MDGKKRAKKENGRLLQGRKWDAVPKYQHPSIIYMKFQVREMGGRCLFEILSNV